jgi:hypothetical protein
LRQSRIFHIIRIQNVLQDGFGYETNNFGSSTLHTGNKLRPKHCFAVVSRLLYHSAVRQCRQALPIGMYLVHTEKNDAERHKDASAIAGWGWTQRDKKFKLLLLHYYYLRDSL